MDYFRKLKGWDRALRKYTAENPPAEGLREIALTLEQRLEIAANMERRASDAATRRDHKNTNLVGREFGRLFAWKCVQVSGMASPMWACLCACGYRKDESQKDESQKSRRTSTFEVAAHRLLAGDVTDCGCVAAEAQRIARYRKTQKTKARAKEARADRRRVVAVLKIRKRAPAKKFFGLSA